MTRARGLFAIVFILYSGSLFAHDDADHTIRAVVKAMEAGVAAGDAEKVVAMYAADAMLLPPNEPAVKGSDAIRKWWGGMLSVGKVKLDINIEELIVSGDLAVDRGTWDLNLVPAGATEAVKDHGKYIVIWRKLDGKWQAVSDIFNSDVAPAKKAD